MWSGVSIDSLGPMGTILYDRILSSLVQVMAWHLKDAKPLPEPMMTYLHCSNQKDTCIKFLINFLNDFAVEALKCCPDFDEH